MDLKKIIQHLKQGGIIIYPTESSYALGGDCTNHNVIKKIFLLKTRMRQKTLPLIASDDKMVKLYGKVIKAHKPLMQKYWPGPLTIAMRAKRKLPGGVVNKNNEIAIRVSGHPIARALAKNLGRPLIATSANISARPSCYSISAVKTQFGREALRDILIIDAGRLPKRLMSTIVRVHSGSIHIIRKGAVIIN